MLGNTPLWDNKWQQGGAPFEVLVKAVNEDKVRDVRHCAIGLGVAVFFCGAACP